MLKLIYDRYFVSSDCFQWDVTPKRTVMVYELEVYTCGTGISCVDNTRHKHRSNRIIFAKPGQERFSIGTFECYAVHFSCNNPELCSMLNSLPDCADLTPDAAEKILRILNELDDIDDLKIHAGIFTILALFKDCANTRISENSDRHFSEILAAKDFIDKNFDSPITLKEIAAAAFLSPNFFRKKFNDFFGISPHQYLLSIRLNQVKKLLITTGKPLGDIAFESGFRSQSYMNYVFKSAFNTTPLNYRNSYHSATQTNLSTI